MIISLIAIAGVIFFGHLSLAFACAAYRMVRYRREYMACARNIKDRAHDSQIREMNNRHRNFIVRRRAGIRANAGMFKTRDMYWIDERKRERNSVDIGTLIM